MSRMSVPQLIKAYNGVPRQDEMYVALSQVKEYQNVGRRVYDVFDAGEALIVHYRRMAKSARMRHENRKKPDATQFLERAKHHEEKAGMIEKRLKELREIEDHQGIV